MKMGFLMGFTVGISAGAIFGGFTALRYQSSENGNTCYIVCSDIVLSGWKEQFSSDTIINKSHNLLGPLVFYQK